MEMEKEMKTATLVLAIFALLAIIAMQALVIYLQREELDMAYETIRFKQQLLAI